MTFPAGSIVLVSAWHANREGVEPDRFDLTAERGGARLLTFGAGIHYCVGANLARAEMQEGLAFLAERVTSLALDGEPGVRDAVGDLRTRDPAAEARARRSATKGAVELPYETIIWEQSDAVGRLTLNRPDSLNAWTPEFGRELRQVLEGDAASDSVRAVLITGAGRGFSSGADLKSGFEPADDGMPEPPQGAARRSTTR